MSIKQGDKRGEDIRQKSLASIMIVIVLLSGCATHPRNITASYVSPLQYSGLSCEQIRAEMARVSAKVKEVSGVQQREANKDAASLGIGLFLFWPALFFMMGPDKREELARLKGEYEALQEVAIQKNCSVLDEIKKAEEAAKEKPKEKKERKKEETKTKTNFTSGSSTKEE